MNHWTEYWKARGACPPALIYGEEFDSFQEFWDSCERGDWMLWILGTLEPCSPRLIKLCCFGARLTLPIFEKEYPNDNRMRTLIDLTEAFADGKCDRNNLQNALEAAWTAIKSGRSNKAKYSALDAIRSALNAGMSALDENTSALDAALSALDADLAVSGAAISAVLNLIADEIRRRIPSAPVI